MKKCEHIIGLLDYFSGGESVAENVTLKDLLIEIEFNINLVHYKRSYFDPSKNTELIHYNFCPLCGEKIDWEEMRRGIENE